MYCILSDIFPFTGWDYLSVKKFCYKDCVQEMYNKYICHVLEKSRSKILRGQIRFQIILSDFLEMQPFLSPVLKYDRILTSNLSDYNPIGDLLLSFKPLLKQSNKHAVLVTETMNWMINVFFSELFTFDMSIAFWTQKKREAALKDTKSKAIAWSDSKTSHIEYWNLTEKFETYLKASLLACDSKLVWPLHRNGIPLPSINKLAKSFGLVHRNFLRNENSIMPFRWPLNCRRVTMLNGLERAVEWVLLHESESS